MIRIVALVEGDGEEKSLPALLFRIVQNIDPMLLLKVSVWKPTVGRITKAGGLERAIDSIAIQYPECSILVLLDSDDDCPRELAANLLARARATRADRHISVVLPHKEFEAWFLAAAESLAGECNLSAQIAAPEDPEAIRNAKGWLTRQMPNAKCYSPVQHQKKLCKKMDLGLALQRSRSFQKLWKEVEGIVRRQAG